MRTPGGSGCCVGADALQVLLEPVARLGADLGEDATVAAALERRAICRGHEAQARGRARGGEHKGRAELALGVREGRHERAPRLAQQRLLRRGQLAAALRALAQLRNE